jgi:hypothetical protein
VAPTTGSGTFQVGFLTVIQEASGYLGGYLVTNGWGRPLEFRLSTAVQPNRVQQILYAATLQPYICAELIGKTLVDKTSTAAQLILTDHAAVLELRLHLDIPVAWLVNTSEPLAGSFSRAGLEARAPGRGRSPVLCHPRFPGDLPLLKESITRLEAVVDLSEPFVRIRDAISEARQLGVTSRA